MSPRCRNLAATFAPIALAIRPSGPVIARGFRRHSSDGVDHDVKWPAAAIVDWVLVPVVLFTRESE